MSARFKRDRERPQDRTQFSGKRELADKLVFVEILVGQLAGGREDAECNRQVKTAAFFFSETPKSDKLDNDI